MGRCRAVASVAVQHLPHPTNMALRGGVFDCTDAASTAQTASGLRDRRPLTWLSMQYMPRRPSEEALPARHVGVWR